VPAAFDRLPLGALRVFEAVATHLSFSAAAEALNVTPAAVSQQVKALEGYIQVPLFRRTGRRVEITDEGLELLPAVRVGLEKLESALQQIKHYRRAGPLQITTLSSFLQIWLLPRIRSFRRKHPNVELRFHTSRELVDFSRTTNHVAIRFGRGDYANLSKAAMSHGAPGAKPARRPRGSRGCRASRIRPGCWRRRKKAWATRSRAGRW
jgi:LysR family glycine cleavage system transcriptional activator